MSIENEYDLVYIDTPYISEKGVGVDYADFYHFLNGLVYYDDWINLIDFKSKHHRFKRQYNIWTDKNNITSGFNQLIEQFKNCILVFSYRSNGIPSINTLIELLAKHERHSELRFSRNIKYVLSDTTSNEVLIISYPKELNSSSSTPGT